MPLTIQGSIRSRNGDWTNVDLMTKDEIESAVNFTIFCRSETEVEDAKKILETARKALNAEGIIDVQPLERRSASGAIRHFTAVKLWKRGRGNSIENVLALLGTTA